MINSITDVIFKNRVWRRPHPLHSR